MFVGSLGKDEYGLYRGRVVQVRWAADGALKLRAGEEVIMRLGPFLLIAILLLLAWGGGFLMFHVASGLIHLLLVLAILAFLFHFLTGRRTV